MSDVYFISVLLKTRGEMHWVNEAAIFGVATPQDAVIGIGVYMEATS